MRKWILLTLCLLLATSASAQFADEAALENSSSSLSLGQVPVKNPFSLIDMSKLHFSHSYSLSFTSGGAGSGTAGLLNTRVFYEFSNSLSLAVNLGLSHTSGSIYSANSTNADFLPGFTLDFHPSEKFRMVVSYQKINAAAYYPFGYGFGNFYRTGWMNPY